MRSTWLAALLFSVPVLGGAHELLELPLVVNVHVFTDNQEAYDDLKERVRLTVEHANRELSRNAEIINPDTRLSLNLVTFNKKPGGEAEVQQGSATATDLVQEGHEELENNHENKGLKIYVMDTVRSSAATGNEISGLSEQGNGKSGEAEQFGRVSWFPEGLFITMDYSGDGNRVGINGHYLLHEVGHNAGMAKTHDAADNGVHFMKGSLDQSTDSRTIDAAQWAELVQLWREHGKVKPNEDQQGSFIPPREETHYAFISDPPVSLANTLAWLRLSMDDSGYINVEIAWEQYFGSILPADYSFTVGLNLDGSTGTCHYPFYGVGLDAIIEVSLWGEGGYKSIGINGGFDYWNGGSYQNEALEVVQLEALGETGYDWDFLSSRSAVQVSHNVGALTVTPSAIPITFAVQEGATYETMTDSMADTVRPTLTGLPATRYDTSPVPLSGASFASSSTVEIYVSDQITVPELPAVSTGADSSGDFSTSLPVSGMASGDHTVTALDGEGNFAFGVLTVHEEIFSDDFESADTSAWEVR